jgi:hypothetical protein
LRIACILAARHGIKIIAPVHDAVLIEAPIDQQQGPRRIGGIGGGFDPSRPPFGGLFPMFGQELERPARKTPIVTLVVL